MCRMAGQYNAAGKARIEVEMAYESAAVFSNIAASLSYTTHLEVYMNAEQIVNNFIADVDRKDMAAAMAWVAEDCYYDNVPLGDMRGRDKMQEFLTPFFKSEGPVKFEIVRQAASGNIVMNERIDHFVMKGRQIALQVSGVFEVNNGQITFWRDYFDNGMFMQQLNGE